MPLSRGIRTITEGRSRRQLLTFSVQEAERTTDRHSRKICSQTPLPPARPTFYLLVYHSPNNILKLQIYPWMKPPSKLEPSRSSCLWILRGHTQECELLISHVGFNLSKLTSAKLHTHLTQWPVWPSAPPQTLPCGFITHF